MADYKEMAELRRRIDRLEDKYWQMRQYAHSQDMRVAKLEWMLQAVLRGRPVVIPQGADDAAAD